MTAGGWGRAVWGARLSSPTPRAQAAATRALSSTSGGRSTSRCSPAAAPCGRSVGQVALEGGDERVAPAAVDEPRAADVAVQRAALEQDGEPELREHRRAAVVGELLVLDRLGQRRRRDEPADPQRRRDRLRDRAHVGHALRVEALQGPDRLAVVAVLGVVVVLEHEGVAVGRPREQRGAPLGREHDAGRVLVRRGDEHRAHVAAIEGVDVEPAAVDRDGNPFQADRRDRLAQVGAPGLLDGDASHAARRQRPAGEGEPLRQARGDHDRRGLGGHAAHPSQVGGQRDAQLGGAARVAVAEARVGRVAQGLAQRRGPRRAREERDVGRAGAEVEARRAAARRGSAPADGAAARAATRVGAPWLETR